MRDWLPDIPSSAEDGSLPGPLISGPGMAWNRAALAQRVARFGAALQARRQPQAPVAILADNLPDWIAIDLATQALNITLVPLPTFFTPAQWQHVIRASGVQALFCAPAPSQTPSQTAQALGFTEQVVEPGVEGPLQLWQSVTAVAQVADLDGIQKITFTSGTTAAPKGVCLSRAQQWEVARSLRDVLQPLGIRKHLTTLPLSVLLENIAGSYTALLMGATVHIPSLAEIGLAGASGFDAQACLSAIARHQAESLILLPQMLQALVAASTPNDARLRSLKFVAVGGARTPPALLQAARDQGWPVYEGYGLSECGSVVALNLPGADRLGSVGKPLGQRRVRIQAGEIEVAQHGFLRYLGEDMQVGEWLPTGDLGHIDAAGFLHIDGRRKNLLITSYGRNISPEWPEAVLLGTGAFAQAVVFGEARPYLVGVLVPASAPWRPAQLQAAVDAANHALPDYARIRRWMVAPPFTPTAGLLTANGRPKREAILAHYRPAINQLYDTMES